MAALVMRIEYHKLAQEARRLRSHGRDSFLCHAVAAGRISDGWLEIDEKTLGRLRRKFAGQRRLGDYVHALLTPFAKWSDRRLKTRLVGCGGCARRQRWLNRLDVRVRRWFSSLRSPHY